MLVNLASGSSSYYPSVMPEKIGYGAGTKEFEGFANVVRVLVGTSDTDTKITMDKVCVVETNIDDASGELMGNLVEKLSDVAKDVMVISGTSKKNRPAYLIKIISEKTELSNVLEVLFSESGTLGARVQEVSRFVLPRAMLIMPVEIGDSIFNVHVKVAKDHGGRVTNVKPEFEDIKIIAAKCRMPVKRVMELVSTQIIKEAGRV